MAESRFDHRVRRCADLLARSLDDPGQPRLAELGRFGLTSAASFIGLLPVIAAFVLLQRYFVAGLTAGAVKG